MLQTKNHHTKLNELHAEVIIFYEGGLRVFFFSEESRLTIPGTNVALAREQSYDYDSYIRDKMDPI